MKAQRQAVIRKMIRQQRVHSQEQRRELLQAAGMDVTQATLSRDMRELRLVKVADPDGGSRYEVPSRADTPRPPLNQLLPTLLLSLDGVGNLLVAKTPAGAASALTEALDTHGFSEIVGTIAGDNTILVVARGRRDRIAGLGFAGFGTVLLIVSLVPSQASELGATVAAAIALAPALAWLFRLEPWLIAFGTLGFVPVRVGLLGERLVAFRDSRGGVGLIDEFCPHRPAWSRQRPADRQPQPCNRLAVEKLSRASGRRRCRAAGAGRPGRHRRPGAVAAS